MNPDTYVRREIHAVPAVQYLCATAPRKIGGGRLWPDNTLKQWILFSCNEYFSCKNTISWAAIVSQQLWRVALSFLVLLFVIFPASATSPSTSTIWCSGPYKPLIVRFPRRGSGNLNNNRYISSEHFSSQIVPWQRPVSSLLQIQIRYKLGKTRIQTQIYRNTNTNVWITHDRWNLAPAR